MAITFNRKHLLKSGLLAFGILLPLVLGACSWGRSDDGTTVGIESPQGSTLPKPAVISPPRLQSQTPPAVTAPEPVEEAEEELAIATEIYIVRSGDTLFTIAQKFSGVSVADILNANNLDNPNLLSLGQRLRIPIP